MLDTVSKPDTSMLEVDRWPWHVATAWVLSRNLEFTLACARSIDPCVELYNDPYVPDLDDEAAVWRRSGKSVMLFPTASAARRRLRDVFKLHHVFCFRRSEVLAHFPRLEDADRDRVLGSVWRGASPNGQEFVPLSRGAAWWLASDGGNEPVVLDDLNVWEPVFKEMVKLPIFAADPPPYRQIPADELMGVPFFFCAAQPDGAFIKCNLEGDDWYGHRGKLVWRRLVVRSADLIALRPASSAVTSGMELAADEMIGAEPHARPAQDLLRPILKEAFPPNGMPDQSKVPNRLLFQIVEKKFEKKHPDLPVPSTTTILRASGRRNDGNN